MKKNSNLGVDDEAGIENLGINQLDEDIIQMEESLAKANFLLDLKSKIDQNEKRKETYLTKKGLDFKKGLEDPKEQKDMKELVSKAKEIKEEME